MPRQRFEMLVGLYGDERTDRLLSAEATIRSWQRVEATLATAQSELGVSS
jgi:adenylosuccinate lyase